jgi:hypothetical protein
MLVSGYLPVVCWSIRCAQISRQGYVIIVCKTTLTLMHPDDPIYNRSTCPRSLDERCVGGSTR